MTKAVKVQQDFKLTRGLGLYLPTDISRKWERQHQTEDKSIVELKIPLNILRALFETVAAMAAEDAGVILGRYAGMTNDIATFMNKDLTSFVKMMTASGMKPRWRLNEEPWSWGISRERGWDQGKR